MNNTIWTVIGGLGGIAITATVQYLLGKRQASLEERKNSGEIDTTAAVQLWSEGQVMRRELREEVTILRDRLDKALEQIEVLRNRIIELESKK